jgi:hypothetical protein
MPRAVLAAFDQLFMDLALTEDQVKVAAARHTALRDFLKGRFTLAKDPWLTGSYSRSTIVRQERDIDVMAAFSVDQYWKNYEKNSNAFVYIVREALNKQYGKSDVSTSGAAVLMQMTTFNVDVVPSFMRTGDGFLISNGDHGWKATNPPYHAELMANRNKADARLKPLVKLLKYWNIVNDAKLESFHIEMAVEKMWRNLTLGQYPAAVAATLKVLPSYIESMNDPWEPGGRIDLYLASADREKAKQMATSDAASAAKAEVLRAAGDERAAFEQWQVVFRKSFPAYG